VSPNRTERFPIGRQNEDLLVHDLRERENSELTKPLRLAEHEVHLWRARLDVDSDTVNRLSPYLASEENQRASRFRSAKDGTRFIVARGILRELAGAYLRRPPATICFVNGPFGKPALQQDPAVLDLRFNLAHSDEFAVYAFTLAREVGIDVERVRPEAVRQGIEKHHFSAREQHELRTLSDKLRPEGFFLCWTRKEAYVKARGEGLHLPLSSFDVSLTPGRPPVLNSGDQERWSMHSFYPAEDFVGALVVEGHGSQVEFWDWPVARK
jgi:4'-phosphopantetheinyl transferase